MLYPVDYKAVVIVYIALNNWIYQEDPIISVISRGSQSISKLFFINQILSIAVLQFSIFSAMWSFFLPSSFFWPSGFGY